MVTNVTLVFLHFPLYQRGRFVVPEAAGLAALDECKELGIPTVWLQPGADKHLLLKKHML